MALFDNIATTVTQLVAANAPDTFYIQENAKTSDGGGGQRKAWARVSETTYKCFYEQKNGWEQIAHDRWEQTSDYEFTCNKDVPVTPDNRLEVVARSPLAGGIFEIVSVNKLQGVVTFIKAKKLG